MAERYYCECRGCESYATHWTRVRIVGCTATVHLCAEHASRWQVMVALPDMVVVEFEPEIHELTNQTDKLDQAVSTQTDKPDHARPSPTIHARPSPTIRPDPGRPDVPGRATSDTPPRPDPRSWGLTCERCGLPIVRRAGVWAAVFSPGQFHSEQDAQRFEALVTDHEHRPG
jgi:hypothetical protein